MKSLASRVLASAVMAILGWLLLTAAGSRSTVLQPDKLVIISTTDVKGKTSPCG